MEYQTWFSNVKPLGVQNGELILGVRNSFAQDWFRSHYLELLENALRNLGAQQPKVSFQILSAVQEPMMLSEPPAPHASTRFQAIGKPAADSSNLTSAQGTQPLSLNNHTRTESRDLPSATGYTAATLNAKYTFDNFVVGPNNNMAHAAAVAVAKDPGRAYNPLFIYGDVGLGKTHLMHAVGHYVQDRNPGARIEYVSTESFTNDLINAIREDRMSQFRNRYRSIDILLVDDIQFLAGKERTQEEFFHTFNALHETHKQIILSSDRPPRDIQTLEARLRSRFEWGLITDIQSPDYETRVAILNMNAQKRRINIPQEVLELIAKQVTSNIRELEGALMRVVAYASLNNVPFSRSTTAQALSEVFSDERTLQVDMKDVLKATAQHYNVTLEAIRGSGRAREIALPRQVAMYLIRDLTTHSLPEIGQFFGRDHSTVLYATQQIAKKILKDAQLAEHILTIRTALQELG